MKTRGEEPLVDSEPSTRLGGLVVLAGRLLVTSVLFMEHSTAFRLVSFGVVVAACSLLSESLEHL